MKDTPYPVGPHSPFLRLFQWAWQSKDVLKLVGDGKEAQSENFHSNVIDSDLTVDYVVTVPFPPMPPETQDINILKRRS